MLNEMRRFVRVCAFLFSNLSNRKNECSLTEKNALRPEKKVLRLI
jgi:hypothetical protein